MKESYKQNIFANEEKYILVITFFVIFIFCANVE